MRRESRKLLFDMKHAASGIELFVDGRSVEDMKQDAMLRLAVERQFEIIGKAMNRLRRTDLATAESGFVHGRRCGGLARPVAWRNGLQPMLCTSGHGRGAVHPNGLRVE